MQRCDEVRVLLRVRQFCIFLLHRRNLEVGECTAQASAQPNQPSSSRSPEFPMLHHEWGMVEEIYVFCVCAFFSACILLHPILPFMEVTSISSMLIFGS